MDTALLNRLLKYRRPVIVVVHLALGAAANYLAFWLRFDGRIPSAEYALWLATLPTLLLIRGVTLHFLRLYEGLWRYTSITDLRNIVLAASISSAAFVMLLYGLLEVRTYPRSVCVIDWLLLICFMSGIRLVRRIYRDFGGRRASKCILVFGAGDAGEMIVRDMRNNDYYDYEPIGFVDDDPLKVDVRIHGVRVLGTRRDLPRIMETHQPDEVLVAIPSAGPETIRTIVRALQEYKVPIKTLPNLRDLMAGTVAVSQIRNLAVEDLLARAPIGLDPTPLRQLIKGRRVFVTGAGGSIGAELCRQIAELDPGSLVLFERYENSLYTIINDLTDRGYADVLRPVIGDVSDSWRLNAVMAQQRPEIVFHAAAHKHVPLMELNPREAVVNNVTGTRLTAEAAARHECERFILISSDKAVNPSSVMGATKRAAELLVQEIASGSQTTFVTVRFGNVLGSNGSVVPRFIEQIKAGGPVTVTHPEMRRYFMLVREAVQLVLYAAALGGQGALYVLDMGDQIRVFDMARDLIRLSGYIADVEIPISFTGIRPGEKLFEELVGMDETVESCVVENISRVRPRDPVLAAETARRAANMRHLSDGADGSEVIKWLRRMVPTYRPVGHWADAAELTLTAAPKIE